MTKALRVAIVLLALATLGRSDEGMEPPRQPLALKVELDTRRVSVGQEVRPVVSLVNISGRALKLQYLKPSIMVPEIYDAFSHERIPNAPTYVYNQICANEQTVLPPGGELDLYSLPILIARQSPPPPASDQVSGFWATLPGTFAFRYSLPLKNFLPGGVGELRANALEITVFDPAKELVGVLSFEPGKGYFLAMGTKGGKGSVWLQTSENKILVGELTRLLGSEIKVLGRLERMPRNITGSIPAGALYLTEFRMVK